MAFCYSAKMQYAVRTFTVHCEAIMAVQLCHDCHTATQTSRLQFFNLVDASPKWGHEIIFRGHPSGAGND